MTQHHIAKTLPDGALQTYCGLHGFRAIGGGIEIGGKWSMSTTSKAPTRDSCAACVKKLPAASKPPTIYTKLRDKLNREPSNRELIGAALDYSAEMKDRANRRAYLKAKREAADRHAAMKKGAGIGDQVVKRPGPAKPGPHPKRIWEKGRAKR